MLGEPRQTRSQSFSSLRETLEARSDRNLFSQIMSLAMNAKFATSKYFTGYDAHKKFGKYRQKRKMHSRHSPETLQLYSNESIS